MTVKQPDFIASLAPYVPGKPIETVAREYGLDPEKIVKLASNENPLGPPLEVTEILKNKIKDIHYYPDGGAFYLREKVASRFNLEPNWIIFGNGSCEIIEYCAKAFLDYGEHAVFSEYAFAMYKIATLASNHGYKEIPAKDYRHDLDAFLDAIDNKTKIIYIANPNNPTSTMIREKELDAFIKKVPDNILIVLDEAYYEFVDNPEFPDSMKYIKDWRKDNVLILRTFSKIYGLAGLRVGYGFGNPDLITKLEKVRSPFNLNLLAQEACIKALDCEGHVIKSKEHVKKEKSFVVPEIEKMGYRVLAEEGNFIAVDVERDVEEVFHEMQKRGVIVRPLKGGYNMPTWFRMSFGLREHDEMFLKAFKEVLS